MVRVVKEKAYRSSQSSRVGEEEMGARERRV